jgi:hypothetical protein
MVISKKFSLAQEDLKKIGKGFLIALGGAVIAYLTNLSGIIDYSQYGIYAPYAMLGVSTLSSTVINIIQKWMNSTVYEPEV